MAVRLVVTITAAPGKGAELAQAYKARCAQIMQEPGCEQFDVIHGTSFKIRKIDKGASGMNCLQ